MSKKIEMLPHSNEAEQTALGCCLIDPSMAVPVLKSLKEEDFYFEIHQFIYQAILSLWQESKGIDLITISEKLKAMDKLKKIGGAAYLAKIMRMVSIPANIKFYINIIKNKALERKLEILISNYYLSEKKDIDVVVSIQELKNKLSDIENEISQKEVTFKDELQGAIDELSRQRKSEGLIMPIGFADFDKKFGGLKPTRLVIIGGRPSMGKSTWALHIALNLVENNNKVLICSLQLSTFEIIKRLLSNITRVTNWKFEIPNTLEDNDWELIINGINELYNYPLAICDKFLTVGEIESLVDIKKPDVLIVDFIQQLKLPGEEETRLKIAKALVDFKRIAKEYNCCVILISQLSRELFRRGIKEPILSDFSESGAIEQQGELIMFIHWPSRLFSINPNTEKEWTDEEKKIIRIFIAKNNFGPIGRFNLIFNAPCCRFENYARKKQDAEGISDI